MTRVAVIDYGAGNLRSAARALVEAGAAPTIVTAPLDLRGVDAMVLPGVGAFAPAMSRLRRAGLVEPMLLAARDGVPLVGICLGMQLLFERSEEGAPVSGLGLLRGTVIRLPDALKVPHMGWNTLEILRADPIFDGLPRDPHVYFVHSYVVVPANADVVLAETTYGGRFPALVRSERVWGLQFHPEKSGTIGHALLRNLLRQLTAAAPA